MANFVEVIRNAIVTYKGTVGNPVSLADVSKIARVEPITLISSTLTGTKELYDILHGILNIYAAYYLQAVYILSAELSDIRILKILDKTNPDRDLKTLLTSGYTAYESRDNISINLKTLTLENSKYKLPNINLSLEGLFDEESDLEPLSTGISRIDTFEKLGSAVGKVIEVKFKTSSGRKDDTSGSYATMDKPAEVTIPVVVKLDNMIIPGEVVSSILTTKADSIRLGARFQEAIKGRISFIKDFLFCSDLIKAQKRSMIKDPTNYYSQMLRRVNNSRFYSALSGNISLAGVSSVVVISEEEEKAVQRSIGGKLTNANTRKIAFDNTSSMMIVVVDREWERVDIYVRDISGFTQQSFDSFKGVEKKANDNLADLVKAFALNTAPSF